MNTITRLVPWFGADAMIGQHVAAELDGCKWIGIPFGGGMGILTHVNAGTIVVSDIHRHVVNLARVVADEELRPRLIHWLKLQPISPTRSRRFFKAINARLSLPTNPESRN